MNQIVAQSTGLLSKRTFDPLLRGRLVLFQTLADVCFAMLEHGVDVSRQLVRRRRDRPFEPQSAVHTPKISPQRRVRALQRPRRKPWRDRHLVLPLPHPPRAVRASSAWTVGSSPKTTSPTSASAMARRIAGVGLVTVSDLRSIGGRFMTPASSRVLRISPLRFQTGYLQTVISPASPAALP